MPELIDARSGLPSVPKPLPTVLILDDEQRSVETLARILQDEFDVHCATTIEEAEAILKRAEERRCCRLRWLKTAPSPQAATSQRQRLELWEPMLEPCQSLFARAL